MRANMNKGIKKIIAGTDFSRAAANAVARAALLAAEHGAELLIIHVAPPLSKASLERLDFENSIGLEPDPFIKRGLCDAEKMALSLGAKVTCAVENGAAAVVLAKAAMRVDADVVVVGARGEGPSGNFGAGATAESLVERSKRDVLIVASPAKTVYKHILACVALGPVSGYVLKSTQAVRGSAAVNVLHVYDPLFEKNLISNGAEQETVEQYRLSEKREAAKATARLIEEWTPKGGQQPQVSLRRASSPSNPPYRVISIAASQLKSDLIVIGKNQRTLKGLLLGNTTKHIIHSIETDTLISATR